MNFGQAVVIALVGILATSWTALSFKATPGTTTGAIASTIVAAIGCLVLVIFGTILVRVLA